MTADDVYKLLQSTCQLKVDWVWYELSGFNEEECYLVDLENGNEIHMSLDDLAKKEHVDFYELRKLTLEDMKNA